MHVLYRCAMLPGGATMLITRFGILSWITTQNVPSNRNGYGSLLPAALDVKVREMCDKEYVRKWAQNESFV